MICPGCGVDTEPDQVPFPDYIGTTGGCWRRYSETLALVSADRWDPATNRLMVDAYAAQHPGRPGRQADQSVAVHLVGLLLVLEFRFEAGNVTSVMDALLRKRRHYPRLERSPEPGEPTIEGFAGVTAPGRLAALAERWASAVWKSYAAHREAVLAFAELGLGDKLSGTSWGIRIQQRRNTHMAAKAGSSAAVSAERDAFLERFLKASGGVIDAATIYIGDRLGYYRALESSGPLTSTQLAAATKTHERYAREWLEQQATSGILKVRNPLAAAGVRRYFLPAGHAEVLNDADSLNYAAPLSRLIVSVVRPMDALLEAFRTGGGVPWDAYGADAREGQAAMNRPMFLKQLGQEWIPAMPDIHRRLMASPPARVADVGCGAGWSGIGLARAYPNVRVDGLDVDEPSIRLARRNAREAGVADRVKFHVVDGALAKLQGKYDLVTAFECIHDMSNPVGVLSTMRSLLAPGGSAFVVDERVADRFMGEGNDVEWMMYGWSVLCCLPAGMAEKPSAATGTVMRLPTLRRYAREAGFNSVKKLPIEHFFFSFYRLTP